MAVNHRHCLFYLAHIIMSVMSLGLYLKLFLQSSVLITSTVTACKLEACLLLLGSVTPHPDTVAL